MSLGEHCALTFGHHDSCRITCAVRFGISAEDTESDRIPTLT